MVTDLSQMATGLLTCIVVSSNYMFNVVLKLFIDFYVLFLIIELTCFNLNALN